jgi:hypothetical protein
MHGVQIHGITDRNRLTECVPTVSFTWGDRDPRDIAATLGEQGIFVWDGKTYALAVTERLGLEGRGGMVRIGAVHVGEAPVTQWRRSSDWGRRCGRWPSEPVGFDTRMCAMLYCWQRGAL